MSSNPPENLHPSALVFLGMLLCVPLVSQTQPDPAAERVAARGLETSVPATSSTAAKTRARKFEVSLRAAAVSSVSFTGSASTPSPAESFALNGNLAYVCGDNEVTIIDVTNPANPQVVGTVLSALIRNSGNIYCAVDRGSLLVFSDQVNSTFGNTPGFSAFSLANPQQPQLLNSTPLNKRFFQKPVYLGNYAFVPTAALTFFLGFQWDGQFGDLLALDLTNLANPVLLGTLEQPQISAQFGGPTPVLNATQADSAVLYLGGTTSTQNSNTGNGRLQVADISNPAGMKITGQLLIPGTVHFYAPLIQGNVAAGIGNTGGYTGSLNAIPGEKGNIVVAAFDVTDRRAPALISSTITTYSVGAGGGATRIGNNLFAFAGVVDSANNPVLLIVDVSNPQKPILQPYPIPQPFTSMQAAGATLYATLGSGGFSTYSIPGITSVASPCPPSIDAMVVFDRGANVSGQALANAKTALKSFIDALHLGPDQVGVVSFAASATLAQTLSANGSQTRIALDGMLAAATSYIGSGIAAAQAELTGSRHNPSAAPLMIVVSDGSDRGAPNSTATLSAATAAKAAGIRVIGLQYGSAGGALMQSIASSNADYYVVPIP